jgi:hypothetical protein
MGFFNGLAIYTHSAKKKTVVDMRFKHGLSGSEKYPRHAPHLWEKYGRFGRQYKWEGGFVFVEIRVPGGPGKRR